MLEEWISPLRVFQYVTLRVVAGAGTAFLISLILGPWLINRLKTICSAGRYEDDAPELETLHGEQKKTTPTMGGLLIIAATCGSALLWANPTNPLVLITIFTMMVMGAIGFLDDYLKVARHDPRGLRGRYKVLLQCAWVLCVFAVLNHLPQTKEYATQFHVPFLKEPLFNNIGFIPAVLFMTLVVAGASNAVNLTDGLDGLAVGCASSASIAFLIMAYTAGHIHFAEYLRIPYIAGSSELAVFCGCLAGASLGFLWFNCYPARVFMGDTGSLAIGGAIGMVASLIKHELVLLFVGGVFVMEALSVIIQVLSFRLTGRRVFVCSPIHHHFELKKNSWSETQVTVRFWILSIIFAMIGILTLKIR